MSADGIVTDSGKILRARMMAGENPGSPSWFAIGSGNWGDPQAPPAESVGATGLSNELARKQISRHAYLVLDEPSGPITYKGAHYSESGVPTKIVAFFAEFAESEAQGFQIMEEAVFGGAVVANTTPYALVADVVVPGTLVWRRNRAVYTKGATDALYCVAVFEEK